MATAISDIVALNQPLGTRKDTCPRHGVFESKGTRLNLKKPREFWTCCPGCTEAREVAEARLAEERKTERTKASLESMMSAAMIPERFIGKTFESYIAETDEQAKALRVCREFASNFERHLKVGSSLVLAGRPGTGKSHLAAAILQSVMPSRVGLYVTVMDLIRIIRDTWRHGSERSELEVPSRLGSIDLLVIDEVGVQYGTDAERALVFDVMDRRYRGMKPTILMTNLNPDGFRESVGDRVYDRLLETGKWIPFEWETYRRQARKGG